MLLLIVFLLGFAAFAALAIACQEYTDRRRERFHRELSATHHALFTALYAGNNNAN